MLRPQQATVIRTISRVDPLVRSQCVTITCSHSYRMIVRLIWIQFLHVAFRFVPISGGVGEFQGLKSILL
jgi:hypothetical protein